MTLKYAHTRLYKLLLLTLFLGCTSPKPVSIDNGKKTTTSTDSHSTDTGTSPIPASTETDSASPPDTIVSTDSRNDQETEMETETEDTLGEVETETDDLPTTDLSDSDSTDETDTDSIADSDTDTGSAPLSTEYVYGFDNRDPVFPEISDTVSIGNVTTYGSPSDPAPSSGGACNYGQTEVLGFAAINVSVEPGDLAGQWNAGRMCGQCAEVTAETPSGLRTTVVRIMDKCPDVHCGIDLGGLPAKEIMGIQVGRYDGEWRFVPCEGHENVSDGPPALYVKDGSSEWWSRIQVRNPPARVLRILFKIGGVEDEFPYEGEPENFFTVPKTVLQSPDPIALTIEYDFGYSHMLTVTAADLASQNNLISLK